MYSDWREDRADSSARAEDAMGDEDLKAELERLKAENERLKQRGSRATSINCRLSVWCVSQSSPSSSRSIGAQVSGSAHRSGQSAPRCRS